MLPALNSVVLELQHLEGGNGEPRGVGRKSAGSFRKPVQVLSCEVSFEEESCQSWEKKREQAVVPSLGSRS